MGNLKNSYPDIHDITSYYDGFAEMRLKDYIRGNQRMSEAIFLASSLINRTTSRLLDVGCGIGVSSEEFAQNRDWLSVHAIDISHININAARHLFDRPNIIFEVDDMQHPPRMAPYDLIAMLDVYEHIPRAEWPRFNEVISQSLSAEGTLVLTTPSFLHQNHLRSSDPEGLQIIDETVSLDDIIDLAKSIGGVIVKFEYRSIWRTNDYCHIVITRKPKYYQIFHPKQSVWHRLLRRLWAWSGSEIRRRKVQSRLGLRI